ncbi:MAG: AraC family transcriptional regulator [Pseudomonadales bacterium]
MTATTKHLLTPKALLGITLFLTALLFLRPTAVLAESTQASVGAESSLSDEVQTLKQQVINLNRDLFILEEELLFPANTQVAVFVSLDVGEFFQLDAVHLKMDGKDVSNYLYTEKQVDALFRGGIQRLYMGNVRNGEHEISAFFTGRGPQGRDFRRAVTHNFTKDGDIKYLELRIRDSLQLHQPTLTIKEWK